MELRSGPYASRILLFGVLAVAVAGCLDSIPEPCEDEVRHSLRIRNDTAMDTTVNVTLRLEDRVTLEQSAEVAGGDAVRFGPFVLEAGHHGMRIDAGAIGQDTGRWNAVCGWGDMHVFLTDEGVGHSQVVHGG